MGELLVSVAHVTLQWSHWHAAAAASTDVVQSSLPSLAHDGSLFPFLKQSVRASSPHSLRYYQAVHSVYWCSNVHL